MFGCFVVIGCFVVVGVGWLVGWLVDKQLPPEAELVTLPVAVATAQAGVRQVLVFCWVRLNPSCPLAW